MICKSCGGSPDAHTPGCPVNASGPRQNGDVAAMSSTAGAIGRKGPIYLADGVYALFSGYDIKLSCQRDGGSHYIYVDGDVLDALIKYARTVGMLPEEKP